MSVSDLSDTTHAAPLGEILGVLPALAFSAMCAGALTHRLSFGITQPLGVVLAVGGIIALIVYGVSAYRHRDAQRLSPTAGGILLFFTAVVLVFGVSVREELRQNGDIAALTQNGDYVPIVATVVTEPRRVAGRWLTLVQVTHISGQPVRQRAAVLHTGDAPALGFGIAFSASARPLAQSGFHRWLAQQHAAVVFEPETVIFDASRQGSLARASELVRERTRRAAHRFASPQTAGVMVALVTGDRRGIDPADSEAMRIAGMSHLTAVSGLHLAVFSAGVLFFLGAAGVSAPLRRSLLCLALVWFAFVTRFQPSVLRAGVMALILLYGACRGRVGDARYALCVTVLMLLAVDPRLAASVGLQLSATATAGVLLVSPLLRRRLPQQLPPRLRDVVAVTGGAQLTVMPLLLGTFGTVSLVAFPANVLAAFFVLPAAVFGFLGAIGAVIHPLIGSAVFFLASPFAAVVIRIAHFFAPLPVVLTWRSAAVLLLIVVGVIGLYRLRRRLVVLVAVVVIVGLFATLWQLPVRTGDDALVLTAIDVGQGDAWLVEYDGVRIMVDAGTDGTAARWMRRHGRRAVDLLVLTHPHLDHIGGAVEVLNRLRVAHVWMMTYDDDGALAAQVRATAQQQNSVLAEPPVFATVALGQMQISVLNPPPNRSYSATSSEWNNESIVLRIVAPTGSVLLLGDTEDAAHQRLLTSGFDLSADVIAVPHHGSATTDLALFRAVGAHTAVLSVGGDNPYGHPHREVIAALNAAQTRIVRTDENGTVRIVVTAAQRVAAASVANDEGVQDERRYRRTVRRVRPGRGEPRRVGPHDPCQQDGGCSRATRETSRGSRWRQSAPRQHFGV